MSRDLHETSSTREEDAPEPPQLRRLRRLVSLLMVVLMVGILLIVGALAWKLTRPSEASRLEPIDDQIIVAPDIKVLSVSRAGDRVYLLTENKENGVRTLQEHDAADMRVIRFYQLVPQDAD